TQKSILERKAPPTFDVVVEQQSWQELVVHRDVAETVDIMLRGQTVVAEERLRDEETGRVTARRVGGGGGGSERARGRSQVQAPYQVRALAPTGTAPGDMSAQRGAEVITLERSIPVEEGIYVPEGQS